MKNQTGMKIVKVITRILFLAYILLVFYFTFFSDGFHRNGLGEYRYNLTPFQEIHRYPRMKQVYGSWVAFYNLFGNIFVFSPFGFFLPFHRRKFRSWYLTIGLTFAFSLFIETTQLIWQIGVFDVDDLILNTLGGALGYLGYFIAFQIYVRYRRSRGAYEVVSDGKDI